MDSEPSSFWEMTFHPDQPGSLLQVEILIFCQTKKVNAECYTCFIPLIVIFKDCLRANHSPNLNLKPSRKIPLFPLLSQGCRTTIRTYCSIPLKEFI